MEFWLGIVLKLQLLLFGEENTTADVNEKAPEKNICI